MKQTVQVSDVRALRALAHPLRNRLLGLLRLEGSSTATLLGARVGESSGSTSYHLRQLAAYGFVEEVQGRGAGRWWQARHRQSSWTAAGLQGQPDGQEVAAEALRLIVGVQGRLLQAWSDQRSALGAEWEEAASAPPVGSSRTATSRLCARKTTPRSARVSPRDRPSNTVTGMLMPTGSHRSPVRSR